MQREAVQMLESRKAALITGLWANDGLNDDKGSRQDALDKIENQFRDAVDLIYSGDVNAVNDDDRFTEEDEKNPFLAPAIKATRAIQSPRDEFEAAAAGQGEENAGDSDLSSDQD